MIRKLKANPIEKALGIQEYPELADLGINHFGDIDYYGGLIFAPLEAPARFDPSTGTFTPPSSYIAAFKPSDLTLLRVDDATAIVNMTAEQGEKLGWLAIDPWTGYLYSSPSHVSKEILRYKIDLTSLKASGDLAGSLAEPETVQLREREPAGDDDAPARELRHMQGGTFTPWGDLVLLNGFIDDPPDEDRGGIHIFRPVGASRHATEYRLVEESVNEKGLGGFKFAYDPAFDLDPPAPDNDEEPEGIDWWNRGSSSRPSFAQGQLHGIMIDNTQFENGESDPDDLYFKHYFVAYTCLPDFDGDGVATSAEVDVKSTDPLNPDTDGDGLSDGSEVANGTNPTDADSDDDGTSDADEDSDSDGLTDSAEVNTHHTDPTKADTDGDGLNDGAEVNTHGTDPLDADSDKDGFSDGFEVAHGTNPRSADGDGDGIPDGRDVEFIQNAVTALPAGAFKPPGDEEVDARGTRGRRIAARQGPHGRRDQEA